MAQLLSSDSYSSILSTYRSADTGCVCLSYFLFQAEDGIRDLVRSRGLGDVYKRQPVGGVPAVEQASGRRVEGRCSEYAPVAHESAAHGLSLIHI